MNLETKNFIRSLEGFKYSAKLKDKKLGGQSRVFTRITNVDKTSNRNFTKSCKSFVSIDTKQVCSYSLCQQRFDES